MTNFEFWKDKLKEIKTNKICVGKEGVPIPCDRVSCGECLFSDHPDKDTYYCRANSKVIDWLLSEHIEKPKLTKRERAFCEFAGEGYIARNLHSYLYCFEDKPHKQVDSWVTTQGARFAYLGMKSDDKPFSFIRWEDSEPWAVEDLLKLEVEEDE